MRQVNAKFCILHMVFQFAQVKFLISYWLFWHLSLSKMRKIWRRFWHPNACGCFWWLQNISLQWRHNVRDGVSNQWRLDCVLNRLLRRRSKKTSKLPVTGLCEENSPVTGEFSAQRASNAENISTWWRHHGDIWASRHPIDVNGVTW